MIQWSRTRTKGNQPRCLLLHQLLLLLLQPQQLQPPTTPSVLSSTLTLCRGGQGDLFNMYNTFSILENEFLNMGGLALLQGKPGLSLASRQLLKRVHGGSDFQRNLDLDLATQSSPLKQRRGQLYALSNNPAAAQTRCVIQQLSCSSYLQ